MEEQEREPAVKLIAGLGNPGKRYENTRHNIGFAVVDQWVEDRLRHLGPVTWREEHGALTCRVSVAGTSVLAVKPQGYMNVSGKPLAMLMRFYKFSPGEMLVVHDDIDLALGTLRLRQGGGHGGNNGVRSIVGSLSSPDFVRLKVGVGRPGGEDAGQALAEQEGALSGVGKRPPQSAADWVLSPFTREEEEVVHGIVRRGREAIDAVCEKGLLAAQTLFNRREE